MLVLCMGKQITLSSYLGHSTTLIVHFFQRGKRRGLATDLVSAAKKRFGELYCHGKTSFYLLCAFPYLKITVIGIFYA